MAASWTPNQARILQAYIPEMSHSSRKASMPVQSQHPAQLYRARVLVSCAVVRIPASLLGHSGMQSGRCVFTASRRSQNGQHLQCYASQCTILPMCLFACQEALPL